MNDDKNSGADKIVGSSDLLGALLATFPFLSPSRVVQGENNNIVVEWQYDGKYFEIEDAGDGWLEIMSCVEGKHAHWILSPNALLSRAGPEKNREAPATFRGVGSS